MQRTWADDPGYLDVEGVIYHYPERYLERVNGYEGFVYYRPARGAAAIEASSYIGYGTLGSPFPDPNDATHRFVPVRQYVPFRRPVPYADASGRFFESRFASRTAFTGQSIRPISPPDFFRILAAGGVVGEPYIDLPDTEAVVSAGYSTLVSDPPRQPLRIVQAIPPGTAYRPTGKVADVHESAALQERAREDHQTTLQALQKMIQERGGVTFLNNNVDLFAEVRGERLLIEAKSVGSESVVVDRMRYGIGQLADYGVRYRSDIGDAERVLAFGRVPAPGSHWVSRILEEAQIAFVALDRSSHRVIALNERAERLPIFQAP